MNENIIRFLRKQTCATICCVDQEGNPYCFNVFYAFDPEKNLLYFKSSANSHHAGILRARTRVAGTVVPDRLNPLLVKGLQFEGEALLPEDPRLGNALRVYYRRFPLAMAMSGEIWAVQLNVVKMTDSSKGFGKKFQWRVPAVQE